MSDHGEEHLMSEPRTYQHTHKLVSLHMEMHLNKNSGSF